MCYDVLNKETTVCSVFQDLLFMKIIYLAIYFTKPVTYSGKWQFANP